MLNGEPESMHARMWGGLLQDTVSPLGDMVHFFFFVVVIFLYVIIFAQHLLLRQALHQYNIYCIAVPQLQELH